jgi:hypothetical protein
MLQTRFLTMPQTTRILNQTALGQSKTAKHNSTVVNQNGFYSKFMGFLASIRIGKHLYSTCVFEEICIFKLT